MSEFRKLSLLSCALLFFASGAFGQIDPERRHLIQLGYNQPLEGKGPLSAYAFYYRNQPDFPRTNMTLRLAIAPVYLDSELGFQGVISERTDVALGVAGGGFADSYFEVRRGRLLDEESFTGHGGEISGSVYHLFNPDRLIPLNAVFRASTRYSVYTRDSDTAPDFRLPSDRTAFHLRSGLRLGGTEPRMFPDWAMELSLWYEGQFRLNSGTYGFGDRTVETHSHLFWGRALLTYIIPEWEHRFSANLTMGTSLRPDRFSVYRLGGYLPLVSEFPLNLPGYYFEEISARRFVLLSGRYTVPLGREQRWSVTTMGAVAGVDYLSGLEQPGRMHSGIGMGIGYKSRNGLWEVIAGYSYGFDALRNGKRGAQSIGVLCQIDLDARAQVRDPFFDEESPYKSRGLFRLFDF